MTKFPIGPDGSKECSKCGIRKPIAEYSISRQGVSGPVYRSNCKACASSQAKKWAKDNAKHHAKTKHAWTLRTTYGITTEQYQEMLEKQGGKCAICKREQSARHGTNGTIFRLSVDHCHSTGKVRGLLCNDCNRAIGLLRDEVGLLQNAIDYLMRGSGSN